MEHLSRACSLGLLARPPIRSRSLRRLSCNRSMLNRGLIRYSPSTVKMDEIKGHLDETYLSWMGGFEKDSVFYYRIHSPVVLIEFDHQNGIALNDDEPTRNHIHTVMRTPNGNDYGMDLLRQHREQLSHARD